MSQRKLKQVCRKTLGSGTFETISLSLEKETSMLHRKTVARIAACAALACAGSLRAEATTPASDQGLVLSPVYLQDNPSLMPTTEPATAPTTERSGEPATNPSTPTRPLMSLLEQVGVGKPLESVGVTIGGYVDGGYTISDQHAPGNILNGRVFDSMDKRAKF